MKTSGGVSKKEKTVRGKNNTALPKFAHELGLLKKACINNQPDEVARLISKIPGKLINEFEFDEPSNFPISRRNALIFAISYNYLEVVKILLGHPGVDVNHWHGDLYKKSPLKLAISYNRSDILKELLKRPDIKFQSGSKSSTWNAFTFACKRSKNLDILKILLEDKRVNPTVDYTEYEDSRSNLEYIMLYDDVELFEKLLAVYAAKLANRWNSPKQLRWPYKPIPKEDVALYFNELDLAYNIGSDAAWQCPRIFHHILDKYWDGLRNMENIFWHCSANGRIFEAIRILKHPHLRLDVLDNSGHPLLNLLISHNDGVLELARGIISHPTFEDKHLDVDRFGNFIFFYCSTNNVLNHEVAREVFSLPGMFHHRANSLVYGLKPPKLAKVEGMLEYVLAHPEITKEKLVISEADLLQNPLLAEFVDNPTATKRRLQKKLGFDAMREMRAARLLVVTLEYIDNKHLYNQEILCDHKNLRRYLKIMPRLPMELQMRVCNLAYGLDKDFVDKENVETACVEFKIK